MTLSSRLTSTGPSVPDLDVRTDFPLLGRLENGHPLVYLDTAATSQKPRAVLEAMEAFFIVHNANVHRGVYGLAQEATELYEDARTTLAAFLNAPDPRNVVFTRGTTEAINLVAHAWGLSHLRPGDEIVVTELEHHSNLVPWQLAAGATGARLRAVRLTPDGRLDLGHLQELLASGRVRMVAVGHVSNVLGTVHPVAQIARLAHAAGALCLVDGAQAAGHRAVDVQALGVDFYALSGHKMYGPTGIGALWGRAELLEAMPPFMGGGEMIETVEIGGSTFAPPPLRFEPGTPPIAQAVGLAAAVRFLEAIGLDRVRTHEAALLERALRGLDALPGVVTYGPRGEDRAGVISFNVRGVHPHDVATFLDEDGVTVRAGQHCAQPAMRALGVDATARASFGVYTTPEDVDAFLRSVERCAAFFASA
ncbi:cysteine desulfurase [Deinococcus sp. NW-56]|uniref:cysteine desulfurase n=1 Tax=Deinococcus sp. NW-56 TaxID=2080419 RepID=UPI000CF3E9EB|nr:cysteine desulfurase [Deinococcus sp. NW-56]